MKRKLNILLIFSFLSTFIGLSAQNQISIIAPKNGVVLNNNMPNLIWKKMAYDYYEVWIDNIKMDSISGRLNSCTTFPLSFGKHQWKLIGFVQSRRVESPVHEFVIDDQPLSELPDYAILLRNNWKVASSEQVQDFGSKLSVEGINTQNWANTSIPATVLTALVRNGYYPNPYIGMNNMRIPDSNDEYNKEYDLLKYSHIKGKNPWAKPYWFRTEFELKYIPKNKIVWLNFNEINYRADVWLNGQRISDTATMVGMERQFRFQVNPFVKTGKNVLLVLIYPLDFTGKPAVEPLTPFSDPGTNMADGMTGKNYAKWDVLGWDWQPAVRDRDMGITEDVFISFTDAVELRDLYLSSDMALPDTSTAMVSVSFDMVNHSNAPYEGVLKARFELNNSIIAFEQAFKIGPNATQSFNWDPSNQKNLLFKNPKLWWPIGYGKPNLYNFKIEAVAQDGSKSEIKANLGIRKLETYIGSNERVYKLNGREIYLKGGNWVIDMMLNWTSKRYEHEILLTKNANLNILRVWGPTGVPPESFYEAADKNGVLIWQDFLNDFWGTFRNTPGFQPEISLYEKASIEVVKRLRNHPSLIIWCGGNEGVNPRESLLAGKILAKYDYRSSRHYLKQSDGDGLHGGGPYRSHYPKEYFSIKKLSGFSSEIGSNGIPVFSSIEKFMPELGKSWQEGHFPIDGVWAYHDANNWPDPNDSRKFSFFDNLIRDSYGAPQNTDLNGYANYIEKCQLANYDINRAAIESINRQLWSKASGVILWKSNSSWPSMVWQVYDWYLQAHAGFYGVKKAAEAVHIQLNRDDNSISVWNSLYKDLDSVTCKAILYNSKMEIRWKEDITTQLKQNAVLNLPWQVPVAEELVFLKLSVKDKKGVSLSENLYWLQRNDNFTNLNSQLGNAVLSVKASAVKNNEKTTVSVNVKNTSEKIALLSGFCITGKESEAEILPSYWSENYLNLLPGESKTIKAEIFNGDIMEPFVVSYKSFNMEKPMIVEITK